MRRNKGKRRNIILFVLLLSAVIAAGYLYTAPEFEREAPKIALPSHLYWNGKDPLKIEVSDNRGLRSYEVDFGKEGALSPIARGTFADAPTKATVSVSFPKKRLKKRGARHYRLVVKVTDTSFWHFFQGNTAQRSAEVTIDFKRPDVTILANSRMISQGGSALVVFYADDAHMKSLYVSANGNRFNVVPYKKEGYYAALLAWPFRDDTFDAQIVATDEAGNVRKVHIPYYHKNPKYRTSYIRAKDSFINGKISDLASEDPEYADIKDPLEKLRAVNEKMRAKNEALIHKLASRLSDEMISSWHIRPFRPLKNGKKVAGFGDHRYYYYGDRSHIVSESYHLGYDLASVKMANIVSSNPGKVVFADENGIYGNMPMIDHGLGLYTIYGHCSKLLVKEGDRVEAGETIAKTGMTGLALGDHLHFGILVQGIEVRPVEWLDRRWIHTFIDNVFKEADRIIDAGDRKSLQKTK